MKIVVEPSAKRSDDLVFSFEHLSIELISSVVCALGLEMGFLPLLELV